MRASTETCSTCVKGVGGGFGFVAGIRVQMTSVQSALSLRFFARDAESTLPLQHDRLRSRSHPRMPPRRFADRGWHMRRALS